MLHTFFSFISHMCSVVFFFFVRPLFLTTSAGTTTLHDDGSVFQTLLPCLLVPEGEKGPFISLLLIVWFPVAAGELVVLQGKERRPMLAQELVRSHFICLQTLRWLRAIPLSLELCRNTKRWHLTASVYQFLFLSSPFFSPFAISSCYRHPCSACHCLFCSSRPHKLRTTLCVHHHTRKIVRTV